MKIQQLSHKKSNNSKIGSLTKKSVYRTILFLFSIFLLLYLVSPLDSQQRRRKEPRCRNCFSVNFSNVDIRDWLKTMASLIRRNILVDGSVKGKITVISYRKVPESRALAFMQQVLEVKGYGIIEEPNLIKIYPLRQAQEAVLPEEKKVTVKSAGVISRIISLPPEIDVNEVLNVLKSASGSKVSIVPFRPTNTLIITGFARNVLRVLDINKKLMEEVANRTELVSDSASVHIYNAHHITAESLARVLSQLDAPQSNQQKSNKKKRTPRPQKIRAVAHKESNSLVITATAGEWLGIKQIIKKLDVPRSQILLEVLIAEISASDMDDFGIDWRANNTIHSQFNTGLAGASNIVSTSDDGVTLNPNRNILPGFSFGYLNNSLGILGFLNAQDRKQNFNILSSPQILALNNQEAEINVGQDVPIQTRQQSGTTTDATLVSNYEYRPAGIKLKITPQINPSGQITLDLFIEISNIENQGAAASAGGNPTFSKRNVKTNVTAADKQTIVLGGLISTEKSKTVTKIPFLGDIPLLGYLFRRTTNRDVKRNLMVFVTPHMLLNRKQADKITDFKRGEQRSSLRKLNNEIIVWPEKKLPDN